MSLLDALLLDPYRTNVWARLTSTAIRQVLSQWIEGNTAELVKSLVANSMAFGIGLGDQNDPFRTTAPFVHPQSVLRSNFVRGLDPAADPDSLAILIRSSPKALVDGNVVQVGSTNPIQETWSTARFFGNQTPGGTFVPGFADGARIVQGLESSIQDSLTAAFL